MRDIKSLFSKYATLGLSDKRGKEAFIAAVSEVVRVTLTPTQLTVKKTEVSIQAPSSITYVIKQNKKEILQKMEQMVGKDDTYQSIR